MNISMYQASTPRFVNALKNLSAILDKAQAHAEANKIEPTVLTNCRLFPNMFPMKRQVQIACDTAKGAVARLAGVEVPKHEDTEETFAELKARIAKTVDFIQSIKPAQIDGSEAMNLARSLTAPRSDTAKSGLALIRSRKVFLPNASSPQSVSDESAAPAG